MDEDKLEKQRFIDAHENLDKEVVTVDGHAHMGFMPTTVPYWTNEFEYGTMHTGVTSALRQIEDDERRLSNQIDFMSHWNSSSVQDRLHNGLARDQNRLLERMTKTVMDIHKKYAGLESNVAPSSSSELSRHGVLDSPKIDINVSKDADLLASQHYAASRETLQKVLTEMRRQRDACVADLNRIQKKLVETESALMLSKENHSFFTQQNQMTGWLIQSRIQGLCNFVCQNRCDDYEVVSSGVLLHQGVGTHSIRSDLVIRETPRCLFTVIHGLENIQDDTRSSIEPAFRFLAYNAGQEPLNLALFDRCVETVNEAEPQIRRLLLGAICTHLQLPAETVAGADLNCSCFQILLLLRSLELMSLWLTEVDWESLHLATLLRSLEPQVLEQKPLIRALYNMIDHRMRNKQETILPTMLRHVARPGQDMLAWDQNHFFRDQNALVIITYDDDIVYVPQNQLKVLFQDAEKGADGVRYRIIFENCAKLGSWSTTWQALNTIEAYMSFTKVIAPLIETLE